MKKILRMLLLALLCLQFMTAAVYAQTEDTAPDAFSVIGKDGKEGVVNAYGIEIIPVEWDSVVLDDAGRKALCINYPEGPVAVVDLNTAEVFYQEDNLPAAYVSDRYALQGNVRVYTRGAFVGLEDADGNALCDAKYDCIEAFRGFDYAITYVDDKCGVIGRDGREILPAEWDDIEMASGRTTALCEKNDGSPRSIFDLETGMLLYEEAEDTQIMIAYDRIIIQRTRPPYMAKVYDSRMQPVFSISAKLHHFETFYTASFNDGSEGMVDLAGNVVIDGLSNISYLRDGWAAYFRSEYIYANEEEQKIDEIGNGLDRLLRKNRGNYRERNCLEWVMYRLGMETQPRQEKKYLGIISVNGERFEYDGAYVKGAWGDFPDEAIDVGGEGMYLVNVAADDETIDGGWTYLDANGQQAVPGRYDSAYMFIEGSAVVYNDGEYYLIDKNGEKLCDIGDLSCWDHGMDRDKEQKLIARCYGGEYHRLIDRRGGFVNDVRYRRLNYGLDGYFIAEKLEGGAVLLDVQGNAILDEGWDIYAEGTFDDVPGAWLWKDELLYHIDLQTGEKTHIQGYTEVNARAARLPDGKNWVVYDENGNPVGPWYEKDNGF